MSILHFSLAEDSQKFKQLRLVSLYPYSLAIGVSNIINRNKYIVRPCDLAENKISLSI